MATKTSTAVNNLVTRSLPVGVTAVRVTFNANGATLSANDVIQMVRVPNQATVLDLYLSGIIGNDGAIVSVGDGGAAGRYLTGVTFSATAQLERATALPYRYSFSDDTSVQTDTIDITVTNAGSATVTCSLDLVVWYQVGGGV